MKIEEEPERKTRTRQKVSLYFDDCKRSSRKEPKSFNTRRLQMLGLKLLFSNVFSVF